MIVYLFSIIIGIFTGILASFAVWWFLFHKLVPKIDFSDSISKTLSLKENIFDYCIKIENSGKRSIIDLELMARLSILGIGQFPKTTWQYTYIPLSLDGSKVLRIPNLKSSSKNNRPNRIIRFHINKLYELIDNPNYSEKIKEKIVNDSIKLEDLLSIGNKATLHIELFGYDEFSGSRKFFKSKNYIYEDIKEGPFYAKGLEISIR